MIKFVTVYIPRKSDGSFQPYSKCDKCRKHTTVYLKIINDWFIPIHTELICMGCLDEGKQMICDRMVKEYTDA